MILQVHLRALRSVHALEPSARLEACRKVARRAEKLNAVTMEPGCLNAVALRSGLACEPLLGAVLLLSQYIDIGDDMCHSSALLKPFFYLVLNKYFKQLGARPLFYKLQSTGAPFFWGAGIHSVAKGSLGTHY